MSPAKRRVIVSLSCLGLVKFSCGGSSRGTSSAGSFMICEVVPQEKNNMEMIFNENAVSTQEGKESPT